MKFAMITFAASVGSATAMSGTMTRLGWGGCNDVRGNRFSEASSGADGSGTDENGCNMECLADDNCIGVTYVPGRAECYRLSEGTPLPGQYHRGTFPGTGPIVRSSQAGATSSDHFCNIKGGGARLAQEASIDPTTFRAGKCYVPVGETLGPQMKDGIDLFGRDWIKYWSPNAEHDNGNLDSPETASAGACCEKCESMPDCNMWTWTKSQQGCYLKKSSPETTYVKLFDETRVSGGWKATVHVDTDTTFEGDATTTTVQHAAFNDHGVMVNHENPNELHRRLSAQTGDYMTRLGWGSCNDVSGSDFSGSSMGLDGTDENGCNTACLANDRCVGITYVNTRGECYLLSEGEPLPDLAGHWRGTRAGTGPVVRSSQAGFSDGNVFCNVRGLRDQRQGIDYPSEDFVKFSNGRAEALTPATCAEACTVNGKCEYWSWSHNDPEASCYLKSNFAMADKSFSYGYPVRCATTRRSLSPTAILIIIFFFFFFLFFFLLLFSFVHNRPTPSASCRASFAAAPTALAPRRRSLFRLPSFARTLNSSP